MPDIIQLKRGNYTDIKEHNLYDGEIALIANRTLSDGYQYNKSVPSSNIHFGDRYGHQHVFPNNMEIAASIEYLSSIVSDLARNYPRMLEGSFVESGETTIYNRGFIGEPIIEYVTGSARKFKVVNGTFLIHGTIVEINEMEMATGIPTSNNVNDPDNGIAFLFLHTYMSGATRVSSFEWIFSETNDSSYITNMIRFNDLNPDNYIYLGSITVPDSGDTGNQPVNHNAISYTAISPNGGPNYPLGRSLGSSKYHLELVENKTTITLNSLSIINRAESIKSNICLNIVDYKGASNQLGDLVIRNSNNKNLDIVYNGMCDVIKVRWAARMNNYQHYYALNTGN